MTLEQANTSAIIAAEAGDLELLKKALRARRTAIADLKHQPPSPELAERMRRALEAGKSIASALFLLNQRLGFESARMARFADGLAIGCGADRRSQRGSAR